MVFDPPMAVNANAIACPDFPPVPDSFDIKAISVTPVTAIVAITVIFSYLVLGFLLGFGLISKYALSKNEQAMAKGQEIRAKLSKVQGPLGLIAIAAGLYWIIVLGVLHIHI